MARGKRLVPLLGAILLGMCRLIPAQAADAVRVDVRLVPVAVTVVDADGRPVNDLTADDFKVFDDGVPREIRFFSLERLAPDPDRAGDTVPLARDRAAGLQRSGRRTFLIYLGQGGTTDTFKAMDDLIVFVRERLLPQDRVAVMAYNRATDFTTDRQRIADILKRYQERRGQIEILIQRRSWGNALEAIYASGLPAQAQRYIDEIFEDASAAAPPRSTDGRVRSAHPAAGRVLPAPTGGVDAAAILADPGALAAILPNLSPKARGMVMRSVIPTDPFDLMQLLALTDLPFGEFMANMQQSSLDMQNLFAAVNYLRYLEGPKYILLFSDQGIFLPRMDHDRSLAAVANDAQVAIHTFKTGGVDSHFSMDKEQELWGRETSWQPAAPTIVHNSRDSLVAMSSLRTMADATGGLYTIHRAVAPALERLDACTRSSYLLGVDPGDIDWTGKYHRLQVEVARPGVRVHHRHGYYAYTQTVPYDAELFLAESRIEAALAHKREWPGIRFRAKMIRGAVPGDAERRQIRLTVEPDSLAYAVHDGIRTCRLYLAVYYTVDGRDISGNTWSVLDVDLDPPAFARSRREGIGITITLPPQVDNDSYKAIVYCVNADRVGSRVGGVFARR